MTDHFTKEGLNRLDQLNNANVTNPYVVIAQIYHKPYPDQIGLFGNTNHSFILNDDSKRIVSHYYLEGTSSFELDDNTISTSIMFFNRKLSAGYIVFISGNTSNIQVRGMIPYEERTGVNHLICVSDLSTVFRTVC